VGTGNIAGEISHMNGNTVIKEASLHRNQSDLDSLLRLSARIGRDRLLIHGSSGNTSLKIDGTLWIKASGKWLAHADQEEILVPVCLSECLDCLREGGPLPPCRGSFRTRGLCPSIETFMHAVLPERVVVHVHSVNTIASAVCMDAPVQLARKLSGLRWQWIPYLRSGRALARGVQTALSMRPDTNVFILGNHGLVVCGEHCSVVESLLFEVEQRLATHPRSSKFECAFLKHLQHLSRWRLPEMEELHMLGTDAISQGIMRGGVLYPCQAIFLGRTLPMISCPKGVSEVLRRIHELNASTSFLIFEGIGVLINNEITAGEYAVLQGFAEVVRRIDVSARIRYLTDHEVDSVLSTDGRRYRISAKNNMRCSIAGS